MKLYDFLAEQAEVDEAAMNPTEFDRAVAQGQEAGVLVGFEFEVHIPEATLNSANSAEPNAEPEVVNKTVDDVDDELYSEDVFDVEVGNTYGTVTMTLEWFDNTFKFKQPLKGFNSTVDAYPEYTNNIIPRIIELYNTVPPKKRKDYTGQALKMIQQDNPRFSFNSTKLEDQIRFASMFGRILYLKNSGELEQLGYKIRNLANRSETWHSFLSWLTDNARVDSQVSTYFDFDPNKVWTELSLSDYDDDDWDDEDDENYDQATKILVPALEQTTGRKVQVFHSYHEKTKNMTDWYIEPDGSLEASDEGDASAEIVSPPMPAMEAVGALKNFYGLAQQLMLYTNSTTGLHINVSIPGKLDVLKLATFLGDQYVLKYFGREENSYAKSAEKAIAQRAPSSGAVTVEPQKSKKPNALGQQRTTVSLDMKKLNAIAKDATQGHTDSISNNGKYFSFRHAGGNYLADLPGIYNSVGRFIRAMIIASDPALYRQEYLAKVAKLAQGPENVMARVTGATKMIEYLRTKGMPVVIMDVMKYKENRSMDKVVQDAISATINSKWKSEYAEFATITPNSANAKTRLVAKFQNPERKEQAEQAGLEKFAEVVIAPPTISILKDILAVTYPTKVNTFDTSGYNTSGFFLRRKAQLPPTDPRTQGLIKKLLKQQYPKK